MLFKCKQNVFLVFFTFKLWQIGIKEGTLLKKSGLAKIDIILYSVFASLLTQGATWDIFFVSDSFLLPFLSLFHLIL